jgi:hypothetical protein
MLRELRARIDRFLFRGESDEWLSWLRIGLGIEVVLYGLSLRRDWAHLFASSDAGFISPELSEAILLRDSILTPRLRWFVVIGQHLGLSEEPTVLILWVCLICAGLLLTIGFCSRTSAIAAWLLHLCAVKSIGFMSYGVDNFTTIGLFYLVVAPLPDRLALDHRVRRRPIKDSTRHGLHRRVLQIHLCLVYLFGGLSKCLGNGWWDGSSIWRLSYVLRLMSFLRKRLRPGVVSCPSPAYAFV